jgi:hypothetical protein
MSAKPAPSDVVILDSLRGSPAVAKAVAERSAAVILERRGLLAQLREVEEGAPVARYERAVEQHEKAVQQAKAAYNAFAAAEQRVAEAETAKVVASMAIHNGRAEIVAALHAGADNSSINDFVRWLRDGMQQTRKAIETREVTVQNRITGKRSTKYETNAETVAARVLALNEAIQAAEDLRLDADQSTVPARIATLREGLPPAVAPVASSGKAT